MQSGDYKILLILIFGHYCYGIPLFEGDIAGFDFEYEFGNTTSGKPQMNGIIGEEYRWNADNISYRISNAFSLGDKKIILKALEEFQTNTCVRFVRLADNNDKKSFLFFKPSKGCSSYVGRQFTENFHEIGLETPGCMYHGIILHEIMHALGFWHEQSRTDRDNYVDIFYENIKSRETHNFKNYSDVDVYAYNQPYDFGSIMHYGKNDFAKHAGKPTILPKSKFGNVEIGQRNGLSQIDIKKINLMYDCSPTSQPIIKMIVEIIGWQASGGDGIALPNASSKTICLGSCYDHGKCTLVSYNPETKLCQGYYGNPTFLRKAEFSLMRMTEQYNYKEEKGIDLPGDDIQKIKNVSNGEMCKRFCIIHPKCNVAVYGIDEIEKKSCWLKVKKDYNRIKTDTRISYT